MSFQKAYHEDWEYDKGVIYYPVHITPGYEAQTQVRQVQSEVRVSFPIFSHKCKLKNYCRCMIPNA